MISLNRNLTQDGEHLFDALCSIMCKKVNGFEVLFKNESVWQKVLGFLAFFNKRYMTDCASMWRNKVYFPSRKYIKEDTMRAFKILAHECVHIMDRKKHSFIFELMYLFPHCVGLLSLGAIFSIWFSNWFLLFLVCLVFFAPIPSLFRTQLEQRGYAMNLAINLWRHGSIEQSTRDWMKEVFTGWQYYRMWPYPEDVEKWIDETIKITRAVDSIKVSRTIFDVSEVFVDVYELLTGIDLDDTEEM